MRNKSYGNLSCIAVYSMLNTFIMVAKIANFISFESYDEASCNNCDFET